MAPEDLKATLDRTFKDELWSKDGSISPAAWTMGITSSTKVALLF